MGRLGPGAVHELFKIAIQAPHAPWNREVRLGDPSTKRETG